jgi:MoaA/NifB/PqqE/SkfB family radical SAM enzyme
MDNFWTRPRQALNIDLSHRCPLECPLCDRQKNFLYKNLKVPGKDLSLDDFDKISNHFKAIAFVGQYSDPIHHPELIKILSMCKQKNIITEVNIASSFKPKKFYIESFKTYPEAKWIFGIDGLPWQSHNYRVNQDGEKLYKIMLESKNYLTYPPIWQYIIFKYNEDYIEEAMKMASEAGILIKIINSARWGSKDDPLKPTRKV